MLLGEDIDGPLEGLFHPVLDDFLALTLQNEVRIILTHFLVCACREADD